MKLSRSARPVPSPRSQRGVSLIIVLIMTVIIGLTAAASMRTAVSTERVVNNLRSEAVAQQYAEAALQYCETETSKASADRIAQLADGQFTIHGAGVSSFNWEVSTTWTANAVNARINLPDTALKTADSAYAPSGVSVPQCYVEVVTLADVSTAWLITARGFSLDYARDGDGQTTNGSVVWLQSYRTR